MRNGVRWSDRPLFPGSKDAFRMLKRAVLRGAPSTFNDVIAEELTTMGLAVIKGDQLVPTQQGREMAETHRPFRD